MSSVLLEPLLKNVAGAYFVLAMVTIARCFVPAAPVMAIHSAIKPTTFALSIAMVLGILSLSRPAAYAEARGAGALAWTLVVTLGLEMVPLLLQLARETLSHVNTATSIDWAL
jgi:hypothetical protein